MRIRERINKKKVEGGGGGEEYESCKTIQRWQLFPQFLITQRTIVCALLSFREPCTLGGVLLDISTQKMRCLLNTQHPSPLSTPAFEEYILRRWCAFVNLVWREIYIGCDCRKRKNWDWNLYRRCFQRQKISQTTTAAASIKQETLTQETRWSVFKNCEAKM